MKIACDSCGTKYAIADDKVRGKVFKIRCKKCQSVIVVRGTEGEDGRTTPAPHEMSMTPAPQAESFLSAEMGAVGASAPMAAAPVAGGAVWHVAIGNDQKGPFTVAEIKERWRRGEINGESYIWREGQADWKPLSDAPEFADLLSERQQRADRGAELFGKVDDAPASGELRIGQGVVSSEMPASLASGGGGGGGGMFAEADSSGGESPQMTGARHDTSVLFSLSNLTSMAGSGGGGGGGGAKAAAASKPVAAAPARTEGSGLIDIRSMAKGLPMQTGTATDDMAAIGAFSPAVSAPILLPMASTGRPGWFWPVIGLGGVAVLGLIALVIVLAMRKPETVVMQAPAQAPVAPTTGVAPPAPTPPGTVPAAPPAQGAAVPAAPSTGSAAAATESSRDRSPRRTSRETSRTSRREESAPAPAPTPSKAPPKPRSGGDPLDDLLNNAGGGGVAARPSERGSSAPDPTEALPETLSRAQIQSGIAAIRPRVAACSATYRVPGSVDVAITIARTGRIQSASASGKFAGTPTGTCVEKAVKAATFPRFSGAPISITYPFAM